MQKYDAVNKLSPTEFKRLTGVRKDVFAKMVAIVQEAENIRMSQGGKPPHLVVEDKLLMCLEYLREYRTYFHLGQSYGLSERACYRNCKWVEDTLIKSKVFSLPGKKDLLKSDQPYVWLQSKWPRNSTNWARARAGDCGYARCLLAEITRNGTLILRATFLNARNDSYST
jgi:hypothetical protein